jgi:hypothetical protein
MSGDQGKCPILLSVVMVVDRWVEQIPQIVGALAAEIAEAVTDYELILVDNGSDPGANAMYRAVTGPAGLPNIQVYRLLRQVDYEAAAWAGAENSLGDYILVIDPFSESLVPLRQALDEMLGKQLDLVLLVNKAPRKESLPVRSLRKAYLALFDWMSGVNLQVEAAQYRLMSKRVVSYLLQQPRPALRYRALPATAGFARSVVTYSAPRRPHPAASFPRDVRRGLRILLGNSTAPARIASILSLAGAALNLVYSIYVVVLALTRSDLQPGWITLSLQQSGMFFLFSLLAFVMTEYMLDTIKGRRSGSSYFVTQEWSSAILTRRERLNVETLGHDRDDDDPRIPVRTGTTG